MALGLRGLILHVYYQPPLPTRICSIYQESHLTKPSPIHSSQGLVRTAHSDQSQLPKYLTAWLELQGEAPGSLTSELLNSCTPHLSLLPPLPPVQSAFHAQGRESSEGSWEQVGLHSLQPGEASWRKGKLQSDTSTGGGDNLRQTRCIVQRDKRHQKK